MSGNTVQLNITFETLAEAVNNLSLADKIRLWDMLDTELSAAEDASPAVRERIQQALDEYRSGDYLTLAEFLEQQKKND